jgi:threonine dehydrogenase-like Zn-dependent dehydrogenase
MTATAEQITSTKAATDAGATLMRAVVLDAPRSSSVVSVPLAEPQPGEVRVRLEGSGVCASSIPMWEGREWFHYPQTPGTPGHEGWGIVDAVGDGVHEIVVGQRLAALSYRAFAEYDITKADQVVPIPSSLDAMPFPGEPLGCAMNAFTRSGITAGETVAIIGVGFLGAVLTRLATNAGARVIAISRRPFSLDIGTQFGADVTIPMDDHSRIIERVKELTGGTMCDCVIECIGLQWPLDLAGELTRERGRLIIAGFHQDGPRQINMFLWNWRGIDVVNAHERDPRAYIAGIRGAVDAVASGALDPRPLLTHTYSLEDAGAALQASIDRPDGFLKAMVRS